MFTVFSESDLICFCYIADRNGGLDFLQSVPNPEHDELRFPEFIDSIDALLMGRKTYETILVFGGNWPYSKPVFVLSNSLKSLPEHMDDTCFKTGWHGRSL